MMRPSDEDSREIRERKVSLEPSDMMADIVQDLPVDSSSTRLTATRERDCIPQDACDDPEKLRGQNCDTISLRCGSLTNRGRRKRRLDEDWGLCGIDSWSVWCGRKREALDDPSRGRVTRTRNYMRTFLASHHHDLSSELTCSNNVTRTRSDLDTKVPIRPQHIVRLSLIWGCR